MLRAHDRPSFLSTSVVLIACLLVLAGFAVQGCASAGERTFAEAPHDADSAGDDNPVWRSDYGPMIGDGRYALPPPPTDDDAIDTDTDAATDTDGETAAEVGSDGDTDVDDPSTDADVDTHTDTDTYTDLQHTDNTPTIDGPTLWVNAARRVRRPRGTPDAPYSTIRQALKAARSGDTLLVKPGRYEGPIALTDGITLIAVERGEEDEGERQRRRRRGQNWSYVLILGSRDDGGPVVTLSGQSGIHGVVVAEGGGGIGIAPGASVTITNCRIAKNRGNGIGMTGGGGAASIAIDRCGVSNNRGVGISVAGERVTIVDSEIANNKSHGLRYDGPGEIVVAETTVTDNNECGMRIGLWPGTSVRIDGCAITDNMDDGIELAGPASNDASIGARTRALIRGCAISDNTAHGICGEAHNAATDTSASETPLAGITIVECTVTENARGSVHRIAR